jgi:hypothetical protein
MTSPAPSSGTGPAAPSPRTDRVPEAIAAGIALLLIEALLLGPVALFSETVRDLAAQWWFVPLLPPVTVTAAALLFPPVRDFFHRATTGTLILFLFLCYVVLFLMVLSVLLFEQSWQVPVIRFWFILVASLLPGVLCYLFVITKRHSLLTEFLRNVERLGLLPLNFRQMEFADAALSMEVYFRKFEAVFGALSPELRSQALYEVLGMHVQQTTISSGTQWATHKPPALAMAAAAGTGDGVVQGLRRLLDQFPPNLAVPLAVATVLITLGWLLVLPPWHPGEQTVARTADVDVAAAVQEAVAQTARHTTAPAGAWWEFLPDRAMPWREVFIPDATPVNFAFLGAYFFSLQMLFRRYIRRDLSGGFYAAMAIRILLAVTGTWAVLAAWSLVVGPAPAGDGAAQAADAPAWQFQGTLVLGFVVGFFPRVVWQAVKSAFSRLTSWALPSLDTPLPLSDLDGLSIWHETRLEEEDVESIPNMATADVVELMLHTPFPPDRIVDWVDQAILCTALGASRQAPDSPRTVLGKHGVRTATGLIEAHRGSAAGGDLAAFEAILGEEPEHGRKRMRTLVDAIRVEKNLALVQAWVDQARGAKSPPLPPGWAGPILGGNGAAPVVVPPVAAGS